MKILIVVPAIGPVYGGPSKIVLELAQALSRLPINIDVVTTNANGSTKLDVPLYQWVMEKGFRIKYFPYLPLGDYKISLSLSTWLLNNIAKYDLVHTNAIFSYPVSFTHWVCRFHQVPYIITPHGMLEPWALSYKTRKKHFYYTLFEKSSLEKAAVLQITGTPEARNIRNLGLKVPLVYIPNGIHKGDIETLVSPQQFYQKFPETYGKTLILFLGRIDPKKGLDLLATAFARTKAVFPKVHLVIAGPNNIGFLTTVQNYFKKENCLDAITFTGLLTGSLKYAALSAASLYVSPSYSEGFSMSILEAMASGLPCVITTGCNFPEAESAQAAYVTRIDADAIAKALIQCLDDPEGSKAMGKRARQLVIDHYSWEKIALNLSNVYRAILSRSSIPQLVEFES